MKKLIGTLFIASLIFTSCDQIDNPIIPITTNYRADLYGDPPTFGAAATTELNVLIEDFTAHQCGNCPEAGILAEEIQEAHPDAVIVVAVHAGNLAVVNDDPPFDTNWVTPEGQFFWDQLDFQANPIGRINRSGGAGNFFSPTQWEEEVQGKLGVTADVNLQIITDFIAGENHLNIHVNGQFANDYPNPTHLVVLFTESELYDYQLWYEHDPEIEPNYHFKHTLRGSVTGPAGLSFTADAANSGDEVQKDYTYTWNPTWVLENSEVIAIVVDDETGEVVNVASKHL